MRWPERSFIASERHRFLYLPIEKVACSSIRSWIAALELRDDSLHGRELNGFVREKLELGCYDATRAEQLLADRSLLRFAFVRNPWDRLVSGFLQKFIHHVDSPANHFVARAERRRGWNRWLHILSAGWLGQASEAPKGDLLDRLTFRQFVSELQQTSPASFDTHWRPQHLFLGGEPINFLGRFERLAEDFARLRAELCLSGSLPEVNRLPRGAVTTQCLADWPLAELRTLNRFPNYRQFYTADLVHEVAGIYAEDIRRFGYDFAGERRVSRAA